MEKLAIETGPAMTDPGEILGSVFAASERKQAERSWITCATPSCARPAGCRRRTPGAARCRPAPTSAA